MNVALAAIDRRFRRDAPVDAAPQGALTARDRPRRNPHHITPPASGGTTEGRTGTVRTAHSTHGRPSPYPYPSDDRPPIETLDAHTGGEPLRVVTDGLTRGGVLAPLTGAEFALGAVVPASSAFPTPPPGSVLRSREGTLERHRPRCPARGTAPRYEPRPSPGLFTPAWSEGLPRRVRSFSHSTE